MKVPISTQKSDEPIKIETLDIGAPACVLLHDLQIHVGYITEIVARFQPDIDNLGLPSERTLVRIEYVVTGLRDLVPECNVYRSADALQAALKQRANEIIEEKMILVHDAEKKRELEQAKGL
jgi:hypothetical protein